MSTNGPAAQTRPATPPGVDREGHVIRPGELGFPLEYTPWQVWQFDDPDVLEYNREVPLEDLHRMLQRDGHMRMLFSMLQWPMRAAEASIEPDEDGDEEAEFCEHMLFDPPHKGGMSTTFSYVMSCLALAFRDGFSVMEKVIEVDDDGRQTLRKLSPRPSRTLLFRYDDHGGLDGVIQRVWYKGEEKRIEIPVEKVLLWTVGKEVEPLQGESLFLPSYYHYDKKHRLYYIAHIASMVGAVPLRVGKVPGGQPKQTIEYFRRTLNDLGLQGAVTIPANWEVETHSGTASILGDILALIEHHDVQASKSFMAQFSNIATEGKGGLGTATSTSELGDLFVVTLETHLQDIAEHITAYLLPYFVDVNFGTGKYPTFRFEPFSDEQKVLMKETFTNLFNATSPPLPDMMFEVMKDFAEVLGLGNIDWEALKDEFDKEQEAKKELEQATRDAAHEALKNPPSGESGTNGGPPGGGSPGRGGPPVPVPAVRLAEGSARSLALAEAALQTGSSEVGIDAFGYSITPGNLVHVVDEPDTFYRVVRVGGGMVTVETMTEDEIDRPFRASALVYVG